MAKRSLKWETSAWSASGLNGDAILQTPLASRRDVILVNGSAVEASPRDGIWVERIVGQVFHLTVDEASGEPVATNIRERVTVGYMPDVVTQVRFLPNLWDGVEAADRFLWERTQTAQPATGPSGASVWFCDPYQHPWFTCIDIRVGRYLRTNDVLCYVVEADPALAVPATTEVHTFGWLRCLVSE